MAATGRPPDLETRRRQQEAFLEAFARMGIITIAAKEAGIHGPNHHRWVKNDSDYARRFAEIEERTRDLAKENRKPHSRGYRVTEGPRAEKRRRQKAAVLEALKKTGIIMDAAAEVGIYPASIYTWCRADQDFDAAVTRILKDTESLRDRLKRERASVASRTAWDDAERRAAWGEHQRGAWTPEMRDAAGERARARLADPEYKADWVEKTKQGRPAVCGNPSYFDQIDTPDKAYWLGFIATDGCVTGFNTGSLRLQIKLARKDRDHLVLLHRALDVRKPILDNEQWSAPEGSGERRLRPCSTLSVFSPQIVNALVGHGITPRKTYTLQPWDGPADLMPHYWRGVIDGDGTICISPDGIQLGLAGTKALVDGFLAWAHDVCGTAATSRQAKKGKGQYWVTNVGGNQLPRCLLAALYDDAPVALERKKALADLAVQGKPLVAKLF
jgi:hypothetical protein